MAEDVQRDPFANAGPEQPGMSDPPSLPHEASSYAAAPPPYAQPAATAPSAPSGLAPHDAPARGDQNALGILSLIAPFVGLALVGIILGHLGLSAASRGRATNRGVALAGTILSWVVTVVSGIIGVIFLVAVIDDAQGRVSDEAVLDDLRALREAVQAEWDDGATEVSVRQTVDGYLVNERVVASEVGVDDVEFASSTAGFCVALTYNDEEVRAIDHVGVLTWDDCGDFRNTHSPGQAPVGVPDTAEYLPNSSDLVEGQCLLDPYDPALQQDDGSYTVSGIYVVPCEEPHYGEVYLTGLLDDGEFPGNEAIWSELDEICQAGFEEFVGTPYAQSELYLDYFFPTETGWIYGQRDYQCMVVPYEGSLEGSMEGAGV